MKSGKEWYGPVSCDMSRHASHRAIIVLIMRSQILRAHRLLTTANEMMDRLKLKHDYA